MRLGSNDHFQFLIFCMRGIKKIALAANDIKICSNQMAVFRSTQQFAA